MKQHFSKLRLKSHPDISCQAKHPSARAEFFHPPTVQRQQVPFLKL